MADRSSSIRNVALVGHGDCGKTTFVEHALLASGKISRAGSVPDGSTVSDHDHDEKERCHSLDATALTFDWKGRNFQVVDCPGYPDFRGVAIAGMWACDTAAVFVNAVSGMGVNTRRMWNALTYLGKARVIVVSKVDADNASPQTALASVQRVFGASCIPVNLPIGSGPSFSGVVSCLVGGGDGKPSFGDLDEARTTLLEAVVETDDELLDLYLNGEEIGTEAFADALRVAVRRGKLVPVLFCSATTGKGMTEALDFLAEFAPSAEKPRGVHARGEDGNEIGLVADGPFAASVFKVTTDVHVGKMAFLRVWRGSLPADGIVWNSSTNSTLKIAHPMSVHGKEHSEIQQVGPGDIFCVAKLDDLHICGTVTAPGAHIVCDSPPFRKSMVQVAVTSRARGDEHKIATALARLAEEDPSFHAERDPETNELIASGRSSLHLDVVLGRAHRRFHVEVDTHVPRVPLKETIQGAADGHHRHKKQTGGRGQFGEVYLRLRPTERGSGFEFADVTVGGSIPKNFIPAIEKGVREFMERGVIAGYPVVDFRVEVYDGKHHPVDSSEAAFKMAGAKAFRDAFMKAKPTLLEPIMDVEIDIPSEYMGSITGDLNTRRGRITGMDSHDDHQVIRAQVPLSEVQTYSTDLRSITSGEGTYSLHFSHLDVVPSHVAQKLMSEYDKHRTEDD